jgi:hypothetical protein
MAYSCSLCFSDQFSYKIHFNPSYGLGNMIYARFEHFYAKHRKKERQGTNWAGPMSTWAGAGLRWQREAPGSTKMHAGEKIWAAAHQAPDLDQGARDQK